MFRTGKNLNNEVDEDNAYVGEDKMANERLCL